MAADPRIGERLREERRRLGLSLAELSNITGLSRTYLVRLENDPTSNPSLETLHRIAEALDTTVADLLGRSRLQVASEELQVPSSLRRFADDAGLTQREIEMLASIRWRKGEQPRTPERWQYIFNSLKASKVLDDQA